MAKYSLLTVLFVASTICVGVGWYMSLATGIPLLYSPIWGSLIGLYLYFRASWTTWTRILFASAAAIIVTLLTGVLSSFIKHAINDGQIEYWNLSNLQYSTFVSLPDIHLEDANDIFALQSEALDGYEYFVRADATINEYERQLMAFRADVSRFTEDTHKPLPGSNLVEGVVGFAHPQDWPETEFPSWWQVKKHGDLVQIHWAVQDDSDLDAKRAWGWYIAFDKSISRMWLWKWNRQHVELSSDQED